MGKILGILGGMGPLATAEFYKRIVEMTAASQDSDHVETIIYSNSKIPKRVEYIMGENTDNPGPVLVDTVYKLISAGAEVIAMPCVTAHFFIDNIQNVADKHNTAVIDAIDLTVREIKLRGVKSVGILATKATISVGFIQNKLISQDIECVVPDAVYQEKLSSLINKKIKAGVSVDPREFEDIYRQLKHNGADLVLIACTDISTVGLEKTFPEKYLDILSLLASECVKTCIH